MKRTVVLVLLLVLLLRLLVMPNLVHPDDIAVPEGYKIEAAVTDLAPPPMVGFDDYGRMH